MNESELNERLATLDSCVVYMCDLRRRFDATTYEWKAEGAGRLAGTPHVDEEALRRPDFDLRDPFAIAVRLTRVLAAAGLRCAIAGRAAIAVHGRNDIPENVAVAITELQPSKAVALLAEDGFHAELEPSRALQGGLRITQVTLFAKHEMVGQTTIKLLEPRSPRFARLALERALTGTLRGATVRVLAAEDLALFSLKELGIEDAALLRDAVDRDRLRAEIDRLASEIPGLPEGALAAGLDRMLSMDVY